MSCWKRVFKEYVFLRSLIFVKQTLYVASVTRDLCCLPLEYLLILEQNGVFNMFFIPLAHPIVLFKKENMASVCTLR